MPAIVIQGVAATSAFLAKTSHDILVSTEKAITEAGLFIKAEVVESIAGKRAEPRSVDTGRFKNSIATTKPSPMTAKVETNVDYADILEYGSSTRQPRHHFTNTAKRSEAKVQSFVQSKINSAT